MIRRVAAPAARLAARSGEKQLLYRGEFIAFL
jgi:hypothetical protein